MNCLPTPLAGLFEVVTQPRADERGRFTRLYCEQVLSAIRPGLRVVQTNLSASRQRGTLRGLHFQRPPAAECKLVRCLRGRLFDVAVDLRAGSPTYGHWHGVELSEHNDRQLFIPEGFGHGFQALTDDVELLYHVSAPYTPALEGGVRHDDPQLAIAWPLPVTIVSERDAALPHIGDAGFQPIALP